MFYSFRLLSFLIHIDQKTVLNWFGISDTNSVIRNNYDVNLSNIEPSSNISLYTFRLIIEGLWNQIQDGLNLADIENLLFFILFVRFIILAVRYNLKTSFYITSIGLFAGYLWYRHLIDLIIMYRNILIKLPFLHKLGMDAIQLRSLHRQTTLTDLKLAENISWSNPGKMIYYAFTKAIVKIDPNTGISYYIDPISMIVAKLNNLNLSSLYYKLYNKVIPKIYDICSKFWSQLSGIISYAVITRIGKRYCPYLIRWHWTFLLIIGMIEQIFIYFIYRIYYFQTFVLNPQIQSSNYDLQPNVILQVNILNGLITCIILAHIGLILFGLFHATWGQYFYIPFFVENTELHIGPRPKNSIYSGGNTAWQDPEERKKELNQLFPRLWYGWFGSGNSNNWIIKNKFIRYLRIFFNKRKK